jgi:hypothetical protein
VTEFILALHPQRRTVFAGAVIFPSSCLDAVVGFAKDRYPNMSEKEAMVMIVTVEPDGTVSCGAGFKFGTTEVKDF